MVLKIPSLREIDALKHSSKFQYLVNPTITERIFDKLKLERDYPDISNRLKVLDLYPGPGVQSLIFNNRYKPKQHCLMDLKKTFRHFKGFLKNERLKHIMKDPYEWSSYTDLIEKEGVFVPEYQKRDHIHDSFLIMANVTERKKEGLIIQWLNCLAYKNWLMKFGNVKMLFWIPTQTAVKLLAPPGLGTRNKCSLTLEAFSDTTIVAASQGINWDQFDPKLLAKSNPIFIDGPDDIYPKGSNRTKEDKDNSITLLEINPNGKQVDVDIWDYVTRNLMILKKTPFIDAVESLGHGAREYYREIIEDESLLKRCPVTFTYEELMYITDLFIRWPFKPDIYSELYDIKLDEPRN